MGGRSVPRGQLYVTAPVMFGRLHVLPVINALLATHADLTARMMLLDRNIRIIEEGVDVAVRIGALTDSALRVVTIGSVRRTIVASPAYLAEHGVPKNPADLARHRCIAISGPSFGSAWPLGTRGDMITQVVPRMIVNSIDAAIAAAKAGVGIANVLSYQSAASIAKGQLAELLPDHAPPPIPVSLLYDAGRAAMPAVRTFIDAMRQQARQAAWG